MAWAENKAASKEDVPTNMPPVLQAGVNIVTILVENRNSQLVVIAHAMGPTELVVFLHVLYHKMGVPYYIIRGKTRLGHLIHRKSAPLLPSHRLTRKTVARAKLLEAIRNNYNDGYDEICRHWVGNVLGPKSVVHVVNLKKAEAKELATKLD